MSINDLILLSTANVSVPDIADIIGTSALEPEGDDSGYWTGRIHCDPFDISCVKPLGDTEGWSVPGDKTQPRWTLELWVDSPSYSLQGARTMFSLELSRRIVARGGGVCFACDMRPFIVDQSGIKVREEDVGWFSTYPMENPHSYRALPEVPSTGRRIPVGGDRALIVYTFVEPINEHAMFGPPDWWMRPREASSSGEPQGPLRRVTSPHSGRGLEEFSRGRRLIGRETRLECAKAWDDVRVAVALDVAAAHWHSLAHSRDQGFVYVGYDDGTPMLLASKEGLVLEERMREYFAKFPRSIAYSASAAEFPRCHY